jgi:hypothetical protein
MKTTKVCTTPEVRGLSTDRPLIRKEKLFRPRRNQGRIREVGLKVSGTFFFEPKADTLLFLDEKGS